MDLGEEGTWTLLAAPMEEFYDLPDDAPNPGRTQLRIAYVESPERMARVPRLFAALFTAFEAQRQTAGARR